MKLRNLLAKLFKSPEIKMIEEKWDNKRKNEEPYMMMLAYIAKKQNELPVGFDVEITKEYNRLTDMVHAIIKLSNRETDYFGNYITFTRFDFMVHEDLVKLFENKSMDAFGKDRIIINGIVY